MEIFLTIFICGSLMFIFYKLQFLLEKYKLEEKIYNISHKGIMPLFSYIFIIFGGIISMFFVCYGPYCIYSGLCKLDVSQILYGILEFICCFIYIYIYSSIEN